MNRKMSKRPRLLTSMHFHSALAQVCFVVEQFRAEDIPLISGHLVFYIPNSKTTLMVKKLLGRMKGIVMASNTTRIVLRGLSTLSAKLSAILIIFRKKSTIHPWII